MLLFSITLLVAWMYWQAPDLQTLKPAIERYLQQRLQLKELHLGKLSWHWSGVLWLRADRLDFISADHSLAFHNGSVAVRIPFQSLFSNAIIPDRIQLNQGTFDLQINDSLAPVPVDQLVLKHVRLNWRYADWHGRLNGLTLSFDGSNLNASSPSFTLSAQLDDDGLLRQLTLQCQHSDWLPDKLASQLHGDPELSIKLLRQSLHRWHMKLSIASKQALVMMPNTDHAIQFNQLDAKINITTGSAEPKQLKRVDITSLHLALGGNKIAVQGHWQDGVLKMQGHSDHLGMPLIWSWLRPLGDADWQHWLSLMQAGTASQVEAKITLPWPEPLQHWPPSGAWNSMQYHLQAHISNADFALGDADNFLRHSSVQVDINQHAMHARFKDAELPRQLGHFSGQLDIPWDTLEMHISGKANTDVACLLQWFGPNDIRNWKWKQARARSTFKLLWDLGQAKPKQASAILYPDGDWKVSLLGLNLQLSGGAVVWDQNRGLELRSMHIKNNLMQATLSLQATPHNGKWKITTLKATGSASLAPLAAHFQLPLSHAGGTVSTNLVFVDGQWHGLLDMKNASWEQLLGSSKKAGDSLSLHYQGDLDMQAATPTIHLNKLASQGNKIKLYDGRASINKNEFTAQLQGLHTPSFSGSLDIDVPFDESRPWKMNIKARYLNRNALPKVFNHPDQVLNKEWQLRADIDQFDWDDARMSGVHINLSSDKNSVGILEAAQIHTTQLDIMDVDARFTLPGQGRVELRKFSANLEKQHLTMSATLTPKTGGGMRWQGFAELSGNFGYLMKFSGLSERFIGGKSHILFSGQGMMLRDQPWWQGLDGRLRLRVDNGRILEGGTMTTLLSAVNLSRLPALLLGQRNDLSGPGIMYERLQMEAIMQNHNIRIRNVAMRSSAFDLIGHGSMNISKALINLYLIVRPLQNLDALLAKIPLLRDILGGASHSLMRKIYHMYGPFTDAKVDEVSPKAAGLASKGFIEHLLSLPNAWFGPNKKSVASQPAD